MRGLLRDPALAEAGLLQMPELLRAGTIMPGGRRTRTRVKPGAGRQWAGSGLGRCPDCARPPGGVPAGSSTSHSAWEAGEREDTAHAALGLEGRLEEGRPEGGQRWQGSRPLVGPCAWGSGAARRLYIGECQWAQESGTTGLEPLQETPGILQAPHPAPRATPTIPEDRLP